MSVVLSITDEAHPKSLALDIYRAEPARRRECLYYLALGHYKMGNYEEARKFNSQAFLYSVVWLSKADTIITLCSGLLIEKEPGNLQAHSLGTLIDKGLAKGAFQHTSFTSMFTAPQRDTSGWRLPGVQQHWELSS